MRKHILSKFAEKRITDEVQMRFSSGSYHTDGLENSDIDSFDRITQQICGGTTITETIEPSDVEMLNAGEGWTKASETIESSDVDCFNVIRDPSGDDSTKVSGLIETTDAEPFHSENDWSGKTESIEPSDIDIFKVNGCFGGGTRVTSTLENSDMDLFC